jgi:hypothetical protein
MRDKDELDRMIDAALASYGGAGEGDEMGERMLRGVERRIAQESAPRHGRWLPSARALTGALTAALAVAACVLAFVLARPRPAHLPINDAQQTQPQRPDATVAEPRPPVAAIREKPEARRTVNESATGRPQREEATTNPLPKLDVFPTPQPMTGDEEALSFFIQRAPESEMRSLLEAQAHANAPVTIDELEIPPLEPLDEGGK